MPGLADTQDAALLVARCLLSLVFAASAYDKFLAPQREVAMLASLHLPFPRLLERGIGVFETVGVASLVLGVYTRPASLLLGLFMLAVTAMFVRFWSEAGEKRSADRNTFFSNLSVAGGCLLLAASGPGRIAFAP